MMLRIFLGIYLLVASAPALAADPAEKGNSGDTQAAASNPPKAKAAPAGDMVMSGLSILGNEETPKELVIVPWKSSQLADAPGISRLLDDSTQPVDKDVFMRELAYYGLRTAKPDGN
jgi:hypothetical protein